MLDESELDAIEIHWPTHCAHCATTLPQVAVAEDNLLRQQVWELPPLPFLTDALQAHWADQPAPSLFPTP